MEKELEQNDAPQGALVLLVLRTLKAFGPLHGYGIARRVEQTSRDLQQLNRGTLCTALLRMEQEEWITSRWGASEKRREAKFYPSAQRGAGDSERNAGLAAHVVH